MTQYEIELRKLVNLPDGVDDFRSKEAGDYGRLLQSIAKTLHVFNDWRDAQSTALEVVFRATQLVALACLPKAAKAFGFDGCSCIMSDTQTPEEQREAEAQGNKYLNFVAESIMEWVDNQSWAADFNEYSRIAVSETMFNCAAYLLVWKNGSDFTNGDSACAGLVSFHRFDQKGKALRWAYPVNDDMIYLMNIQHDEFEELIERFGIIIVEFAKQTSANAEEEKEEDVKNVKHSTEFDFTQQPYFINPAINANRLQEIDWHVLGETSAELSRFWSMVSLFTMYNDFSHSIVRMLKMKDKNKKNKPDTSLIRQLADKSSDEALREQVNLLLQYVTNQTAAMNAISDGMATEDDNLKLKRTIVEQQEKIVTLERLLKEESAHNSVLHTKIAAVFEESKTMSENLRDAKQKLEVKVAELNECNKRIKDLEKQNEKRNFNVELKKQYDEQVKLYDQLKMNYQEDVTASANNARNAAFIEVANAIVYNFKQLSSMNLNERRAKEQQIVMSMLWKFPLINEIIESGQMAETNKLNEEKAAATERDMRKTEAMERQAEKEPAPNIQNTFPDCKTFVNRPNIETSDAAKVLLGGQDDEPKRLEA